MTDRSRPIELTADGVSLVVDVSTGTPAILHWGSSIGAAALETILQLDAPAAPVAAIDVPRLPGVWRENARGFLGRPSVLGHRAGLDFTPLFEVSTIEATADSVRVDSSDAAGGIAVSVMFVMQPAGVVLVSQSVTNTGDSVFDLHELTTWLPLPDHATESMDFTGRWLKERQPQRRPIESGLWARESREGRSGHDYTIVQLAMTQGADYQRGSVWSTGLLWSGNTRHLIERIPSGRTAIGAGELLLPGEVRLEPGETYLSPVVAATFSGAGIDGISDRHYRWLRSRAEHPKTPRPLTLNVWEAVYFNHDLAELTALVDVAEEIGIERFVLDDGWFLGRRDGTAGLGDWVVDRDVWPNGLAPLIDKVTSAGMQFGLWFEGEMVNTDSDLYREHPEWIFQSGERVPPEGRHQQVLDLGHRGAYDHVLAQVDALLTEYPIGYIKWDHNRPLIDPAHFGRAGVRRQTEAIYRLFDELRSRHPGLEIESCSSGGGRIDLGMTFHADRFWTSDCNDALERQYIQRYSQIAIPPELLGSHIGPPHSHTTGRSHNLAFRALSALFGHAGIEWDITSATDDELAHLTTWSAYYKAKRSLLHTGRVLRLDQRDDTAFVHGVVAHDRSEALIAYVQLSAHREAAPPKFRIPGLDADALYAVTLVEPAGPAITVQVAPPGWVTGITTTGAALAEIGLTPPILKPENGILIEVRRLAAAGE